MTRAGAPWTKVTSLHVTNVTGAGLRSTVEVGRNARFFYVIFYGVFLRIEEEQQQRSRRRRTLKKVSTSNFILFPANYTLPTAQV